MHYARLLSWFIVALGQNGHWHAGIAAKNAIFCILVVVPKVVPVHRQEGI
jgi:hypothetical protein